MTIETKPFDAAEFLQDEETIGYYLEEAFQSGDPAHITSAIGDVIRARNMAAVARDAGISRDTLYRAFVAEGNPTLSTMAAVVKTLGYRLSITKA